jgi:hypothetical protein
MEGLAMTVKGEERIRRAMQDAGWQQVDIGAGEHDGGIGASGTDAPYGIVVDAGADGMIERYRCHRAADSGDPPLATDWRRRSGTVPTPNDVAGELEQISRVPGGAS